MKKSIFLFFAAILCASSVWGANAELKNGQILYCTVNNSNWKTWSIKFNWYWNEGDWCCNDKGTKLATDIWYAKIPNDYTRAVQLIRCNGDFSQEWNWSNTVKASSRSNNYQNCVNITGSNWDNAAVSWTTYAPAMSEVTLEDNGTSIISGSGTQADPYLVYTESTIKVKASGTKSVEDPDAKVNYDFKQGTTSNQNSTTATYQFTASATVGTSYTINVDGYTKVNTTSSTKKAATALYYKTVEPAEETHDVTLNCKYGETILQTSSITKVGVSTSTPVSVPEITGYDFVNWQLGDGIATTDAATANPIHITTNSTGDYTLTACYKPETIYFVNTDEWETVNVYAWAGSGASEIKNAEWPGEKLLSPVDNIGGYDVYAFTSGAGYEKVIFNNGKGANQTDDLTWTADKYYVYYGQTSKDPNDWYTKDAVEGALPDWLATNVYLAGSMTDWATNQIEFRKSAKSDYAAYLTVDLSAETDYKLKIVRGGDWTSYKDAEIKDNVDYLQFSSSVDDDCKMKTKDAGTYVFVWYINDSKLSVWYPSEYTVVGTDVLLGENWGDGLDNLDNKMVKQGDNSYKLVKENVVLPANTYEWQIARNGDWWSSNKKVNPDDNNKLPIATAGKYNVTFTLAADLQSATATAEFIEAVDEVAKCYVTGNTTLTGHDWGIHDELEMDYDKTTETYTYTLQSLTTGKDYELKIVCGGTWFDYSALTSPIPTGIVKGNNNAIAFQMAADGDVVVTYNATTGIKLSGNFKEPETKYYVVGDFNSWVSDNNSKMTTTDKVTYTKTLTLNAGEYFFKVNIGSWDSQWGWANVSGTYSEVKDAEDDNKIKLVLTGQKTFTIKFVPSKHAITFENLTLLQRDCFLMGVGEDWENGIKMTQNPKNLDEYMLLCQPIAADEDIKIKVGTEWCGEVDNKDFEGYVKNLDNGNIVLKAGTYDFYYKAEENKVYIAYPSVGDNDNSKTLSLLNGKTATVKVNRTFEAGKLYTIALPFAINDVKTVFGASTVVYEFSKLEKKDNEFILYFNDAITSIEAGKPYLIKPSGAHLVDGFTYENAVISSQAISISQTVDGTTITMEPVLSATAGATTSGKYWLASDNVLYKNNTSLKSLRAVFNVQSTKANIRARVAFGENVETGVDNIVTTDAPVKVIKNGQLIIIRDGVKYNIQGQKL